MGLLGFVYTFLHQPNQQVISLTLMRDRFVDVVLGFMDFLKQKKATGDYCSKIAHSGRCWRGWEW